MLSRIAQAKTTFTNKWNLYGSIILYGSLKNSLLKVDVWNLALYNCKAWVLHKIFLKVLRCEIGEKLWELFGKNEKQTAC